MQVSSFYLPLQALLTGLGSCFYTICTCHQHFVQHVFYGVFDLRQPVRLVPCYGIVSRTQGIFYGFFFCTYIRRQVALLVTTVKSGGAGLGTIHRDERSDPHKLIYFQATAVQT